MVLSIGGLRLEELPLSNSTLSWSHQDDKPLFLVWLDRRQTLEAFHASRVPSTAEHHGAS